MVSSDSGSEELEDASGTEHRTRLFILLNGKKSGDKHLRLAVKHLRSSYDLAS